VDGQLDGRALAGTIDIDAPSLQHFWSGLAGSLVADGKLGGSVTRPVLSGTTSASELEFAEWRVDYLLLQTRSSTIDALDVDINVRGLVRSNTELGSARIRIAGSSDAPELNAEWTLDNYAASVAATVNIDGDKIAGQISSARLSEPLTGDWVLSSPFGFAAEPGSLQIDSATWVNSEAFIRSDSVRMEGDVLSFDGEIGSLPLSVLNNALPETLQIEGLGDATFSITGDAGEWSGQVDWQQRETRLIFPSAEEDFTLVVPTAHATLRLDKNAAVLNAAINAEPGLTASLEMSADDLTVTAPLNAHLRFNGEEWAWITTLLPDIDNIEGVVSADLHATGSIESPALSGEARWQNGALAVPALNLPLTEISITFAGTSAGDLSVNGNATTGGGTLSIVGKVEDIASSSPSFDIRLTGDQADLLNWSGYRATASPDISVTGDRIGTRISGTVDIDSADIAIKELPEGAVKQSRDVTVVGREEGSQDATRLSGEVDVTLGDSFHLEAFGLDTDLEGEMRFILRDGREPQGHGEVRLIDGFFEAYGQRLEIEHGTMFFTGPLDDPLINVRATRRVENMDGTVVVGINLSGRVRELNSSIFSEPAMSEAEALSYLILGRPLEDASADEGNNLSNSAYSLGLRQAALITNQIGQTVGLDELTIGGSNQNTTELIAGKQLNSRLYARYVYGVFSRLGKLLLRYRLSESFSVELGAGEHQSMDLLYTIEKE
jgi:translocation and assembly module TamB